MFGFRFDEDSDAEHFRKRVTKRVEITGMSALFLPFIHFPD